MSGLESVVFEDAGRLQSWLADQGLVPYLDFEILAVSPVDGAVEIDPKLEANKLAPLLERFADSNGYIVEPLDPERGSISLLLSGR